MNPNMEKQADGPFDLAGSVIKGGAAAGTAAGKALASAALKLAPYLLAVPPVAGIAAGYMTAKATSPTTVDEKKQLAQMEEESTTRLIADVARMRAHRAALKRAQQTSDDEIGSMSRALRI